MLDPQHQPTIMDAGRASDDELRATPAGSEHTVQFYEDEAFLRETVARYLGGGLIADEPIVVIATEPHCRDFRSSLSAKGFDVDRAAASGRLALFDARATLDTLMGDGTPEPRDSRRRETRSFEQRAGAWEPELRRRTEWEEARRHPRDGGEPATPPRDKFPAMRGHGLPNPLPPLPPPLELMKLRGAG